MIYVVGHKNPDTDSVVSAISYAFYKGQDYIPAILGNLNDETKFVLERFDFKAPILLDSFQLEDKFILVDHNEDTQAIDNLNYAQVIEILDHHKLNISLPSPIDVLTKPYGSTASLVTEKFIETGKQIDSKLANLLLSAIISDTVVFKSPTTTLKDREFSEYLSKIGDIKDINSFGVELFTKKANISLKTSKEIIYNDFKDFNINNKKIGIGQIELFNTSEIEKRKDEILNEMNKINIEDSYFGIILVVTDIMKEGSYFWIVGNSDVIYNCFNINLQDNYIQGILSRKKQVVPVLEEKLK